MNSCLMDPCNPKGRLSAAPLAGLQLAVILGLHVVIFRHWSYANQ